MGLVRRPLLSPCLSWRLCGVRSVVACVFGRPRGPVQVHCVGAVASWSSEAAAKPGTAKHRLRVCVVGSGPAGFYATKYMLKWSQSGTEVNVSDPGDNPLSERRNPRQVPTTTGNSCNPIRVKTIALLGVRAQQEEELLRGVEVDILDRLPTPFGLVRYGVAPDHQEVKAVQSDFEEVASDPRVHFFGNVCLGQDVTSAQLSELYDVVILAYGAAGDRKLTVPGAHLEGVFAARAFVSWYNGHPEFAHMTENFRAALDSSDTVAVVGVGNVALDCARILAKGADALRATDICDHTLQVLSSAGSSLRRVVVLGRRGHVQASFTIKELRELTKLDDVRCLVRKDELEMGRTPASYDELKGNRPKTRIDALLTKVAEESDGLGVAANDEKAVELRFLVGPSEVLPSNTEPARVGAVRIERNRLEFDEATRSQHAVGSGDKDEVMECGMVLGSIGYRCLPVKGVPYDQRRSIIANDGGRVQGVKGMYCSGWARRGPSGIIGSNIADARSVVSAIVEDVRFGKVVPASHNARHMWSRRFNCTIEPTKPYHHLLNPLNLLNPFNPIKPIKPPVEGKRGDQLELSRSKSTPTGGRQGLLRLLKGGRDSGSKSSESESSQGVQVVDWNGYREIDREEVTRGKLKGKPREKLVDTRKMLEVAGASTASLLET